MTKEPQEKVTFFLPASAIEQVKRFAQADNRSMSYFIRQAVLDALLDVVTGTKAEVAKLRHKTMTAAVKKMPAAAKPQPVSKAKPKPKAKE